MFSLRPPAAILEERGAFPDISTIEPQFALPRLDEYTPPPDRLLAGLTRPLGLRSQFVSSAPDKGKQKEEVVVRDAHGEHAALTDDSDFWLRAGDREPGPSRSRMVKVSSVSGAG
jgi:hypothetical protein